MKKLLEELNKSNNYPNYQEYLIKIHEYIKERQALKNVIKNDRACDETLVSERDTKSNDRGDSE